MKTIILFLLLIFSFNEAFAGLELFIRRPVRVYVSADNDSEVLTILNEGESVPLSRKSEGQWRKVLLNLKGKKKVGYIRTTSLQGNRIREVESGDSEDAGSYRNRTAFGLNFAVSYSRQGSYKFKNSDGAEYEIGAFSGTSTYFGILFDLPVGDRLAIRAMLNFRKFVQTGTAKPVSIVGTADTVVQRTISTFGIGALAKYYLAEGRDFWGGAGLELARANSVELFYGGVNVKVPTSDYPTYSILMAGVGYDFNVSGDIYLTPEVRGIYIFNTSPAIMGFDAVMNASYAF